MRQVRRPPPIKKIRRGTAYVPVAVLVMLSAVDRLHATPAHDVGPEHAFLQVQAGDTNFYGKRSHLLWESVPLSQSDISVDV
jgi:hypothetical protein